MEVGETPLQTLAREIREEIDMDIDVVCEALVRKGIPNLWIPKKDSFFRVESVPLLGTGKIDLKQVKTLAATLAAARKEAPDA